VEILPRSLHFGPQTTRTCGRDDNELLGAELGRSVVRPWEGKPQEHSPFDAQGKHE